MKRQINESGFSRLMQMMSGMVPNVKTFAIITWENPMAIQISNEENNVLNNKLKKLLKGGNWAYRQIKGKYGSVENPFVINNINENDAISIGLKGQQESIIFGEVESADKISIKLIECKTKAILGEKSFWKNMSDDTEDYYSEFKGRKFIFPFFENKDVISENNVFYRDLLSEDTQQVIELDKDWILERMLSSKRTNTSKYITRGTVYSILKESSMSRIYSHIIEHNCAIITAFRGDKSATENKRNNKILSSLLLKEGFGITKVAGTYIENYNTDAAKEVKEDSLFVVNLKDNPQFFKTIYTLGNKFFQDSVLFINKGGKSSYLFGTNSTGYPGLGQKVSTGEFKPKKEGEFMTKLKGQPFVLETYDNLSRLSKLAVSKVFEQFSK